MALIGFDIRPLVFTRAGIKTYLYNLILGLAAAGGCRLRLFISSPSRIDWKMFSGDITEELIRLPQINPWCENFWQEFLLPAAVKKRGVEVFHGTRFFIPRRLSCPCVVTVHDLAFKKFPGLVLPKTSRYFDLGVALAVKFADRVIVPSGATKVDLQELYGVSAEKIIVVHEAAEVNFRVNRQLQVFEPLKRRLGIKDRFILSVGTIEPRKNYSTLLKALALMKNQEEMQLVLAGGFGWLYSDVLETVKNLGLKDRVIFAGYVGIEELVQLYNYCAAFVLVSRYEGFGLPVLEALQCGACAVISCNSALKELFGSCCYLVQPESAESIAAGIEEVLANGTLREELKIKAKIAASGFSWEKAAGETLAVYNTLAGKNR